MKVSDYQTCNTHKRKKANLMNKKLFRKNYSNDISTLTL